MRVLAALYQRTNHLTVLSFQLSPHDKWIKLALFIDDITRCLASFLLKLIILQWCKDSISVAGVLCLLSSCVIVCLECRNLGCTQELQVFQDGYDTTLLGWRKYFNFEWINYFLLYSSERQRDYVQQRFECHNYFPI